MNCLNCKKETSNKKFCCRSCSVSYNNTVSPKRKASVKKCKNCNKIINYNKTYCSKECAPVKRYELTLKEVIYKNVHKSSAFAFVRGHARLVAKKLNFKKCMKCGYDKHVEVCHIKPISSFNEDSFLNEINNSKNLLCLCPNCHWEYDNKLWSMQDSNLQPSA